MKYPNKLTRGDTIGLICPCSPIRPERIGQCVKAMEDLGYFVKTADNLDKDYGGYMAGSGKERGEWVNRMFADPQIKAIFCVRGGDGGSRAMEYLDYDLIRANPKIFVGYSDVTSMHLAITQNCEFVTFHGPMVSSDIVDSFDQETRNSLYEAINAEDPYTLKNPEGFDLQVLKEGKASGKLIGGNLSLLSASIGTSYEVDTKGNLLFIEEVREPMSKIEKWAYHLRNSGKFQECSGVILGQFSHCENRECPGYDVVRCFTDIFEGLDIPIMYNIQSGHGNPMLTLPMGAACTMDTASKKITFEVER